jgi:hypothetical protein
MDCYIIIINIIIEVVCVVIGDNSAGAFCIVKEDIGRQCNLDAGAVGVDR